MAEDLRIIKNRRGIEGAMLLLLQEKDFSKITIQDICREALVSRSTFYAHYLDKYDLLEKIVDRYFSILQELIADRFSAVGAVDLDTVFLLLSKTYSQHRDALRVLMKVHVPGLDLRARIEAALYSHCQRFLETTSEPYKMPKELLAKLYVANAVTIIDWALERGIGETERRALQELQEKILPLCQG